MTMKLTKALLALGLVVGAVMFLPACSGGEGAAVSVPVPEGGAVSRDDIRAAHEELMRQGRAGGATMDEAPAE